MAFETPKFSKGQVNRAGVVLAYGRLDTDKELEAYVEASSILANWRACHLYPINTFQALLRAKLKSIDPKALVAQRLKRAPSIISKLQRFNGMQLARMQDIGGLRAVTLNMHRLRRVEEAYRTAKFAHELVSCKDYINQPKEDGYRGIHLVYRYANHRATAYDGLHIELQIRTRMQHAWATAVETLGTFLGQALKSGQGDDDWKQFFRLASAIMAVAEKANATPGFEGAEPADLYSNLSAMEQQLSVLNKLDGFAIAANHIQQEGGQGSYSLVVLNSKDRTVSIQPFAVARLEEAKNAYGDIERQISEGAPLEAVLVSAGPISALRKAYPNYFLDTQAFVRFLRFVVAAGQSKNAKVELADTE